MILTESIPNAEALLREFRWAQANPPAPVLLSEIAPPPTAERVAQYRAAGLASPALPSLREVQMTYSERVGMNYYGVHVLRRQDPILRLGLATNPNEREWRGMFGSEDSISTSVDALLDTILGFGWTIQKKKGKTTPARERLEAFARAGVSAIPRFQTVLRQAMMAKFYGWAPLQQLWRADAFRFAGKSWRGITQIVEQHGEHFAWTVPENGQPSYLVFIGDQYYPPQVYDSPNDLPAWMTIRCGSLKDPYGHAKLSDLWFLWYRLRRMTEFYEVGARDALQGRLIFQERGGGAGAMGPQFPGKGGGLDTGKAKALALAQVRTEVAAAMTMLRETGITVLGQDLEMIDQADPAKAEGWERALGVWRQAVAIAIEGQTLTASVSKEGGSRALGDTQKDTKLEKGRALSQEVCPQVSDLCVHQLIRLNFPGEIDPDDLPDVVCAIETAIDPEKVKAFVDLGGEVDAATIADAWNVPMAEEGTAIALRRQEVGSLLPGVGAITPKGQVGGDPPGPVASPPATPPPADAPPPKAPARAAIRTDGPHKFSSTQVDLPADLARQVLAMGAQIPDADLAADGRETSPHVTVKYGIHTTDAAKVAAVLTGFGPVTLKLGATALFAAEEYDVLTIAVLSADLAKMNSALSAELTVTDTHPVYAPHITIAYLKPGKGAQYWGDPTLAGTTAVIGSVLFTPKEGTPVVIPLGAAPPRRSRSSRATLPGALAALGDHVVAMAGTLEAAEAARIAGPWQSYIRVLTDAVREAAGEADAPFLSALP